MRLIVPAVTDKILYWPPDVQARSLSEYTGCNRLELAMITLLSRP